METAPVNDDDGSGPTRSCSSELQSAAMLLASGMIWYKTIREMDINLQVPDLHPQPNPIVEHLRKTKELLRQLHPQGNEQHTPVCYYFRRQSDRCDSDGKRRKISMTNEEWNLALKMRLLMDAGEELTAQTSMSAKGQLASAWRVCPSAMRKKRKSVIDKLIGDKPVDTADASHSAYNIMTAVVEIVECADFLSMDLFEGFPTKQRKSNREYDVARFAREVATGKYAQGRFQILYLDKQQAGTEDIISYFKDERILGREVSYDVNSTQSANSHDLPPHSYKLQRYYDETAFQHLKAIRKVKQNRKIHDLGNGEYPKDPEKANYRTFSKEMTDFRRNILEKLPEKLQVVATITLRSHYAFEQDVLKQLIESHPLAFALCVMEVHEQKCGQNEHSITQYPPHTDPYPTGNLVVFTHLQGWSFVFLALPKGQTKYVEKNESTIPVEKKHKKKIFGHTPDHSTKYASWKNRQNGKDQRSILTFETNFQEESARRYANKNYSIKIVLMEEGSVLSFLARDIFHGSIIPKQSTQRIIGISYQMVDAM